MHNLANAPMPLKLSSAVLALALIAAVAVALTLTGGNPIQAQNATNTYTDPQPCGPAIAFYSEPREVTTGHFALFDGYWQRTHQNPNAGVLHTNTCPPLVTKTTEIDPDTELEETVTTLSNSGIDIYEAIFHVKDEHKATVVSRAANDSNGAQISLAEYPDLDDFVDAGDQVWWLRLDDPDTIDVDETSDLTLGFSTRHLDDQYWNADDDDPPLRYRLEVERYPGHTSSHPHFLTYRAPKPNGGEQDFVWSSAQAGFSQMKMEPGTQIEDLQWIFTDPGTYEIWVELVAYVRQSRPTDAADDWARISDNLTETSGRKRYTIHVGDALTLNHKPAFLMERSVAENSAAGVAVGAAIPVHDPDGDPLAYRLSGPASELFALSGSKDANGRFTDPPTIVTAANSLDHEARPHHFLTLHVGDGKGITGYADPALDNAVRVKVNVADVDEVDLGQHGGVRLIPSATSLKVGETVSIRAAIGDLTAGRTNPIVRWNVEDPPDADPVRSEFTQEFTRDFTYDTPGSRTFYVGLFYTRNGQRPPGHLSDKITVTWVADGN